MALLAVGLTVLGACGAPVPGPGTGDDASAGVHFEPSASLEQVPNVVHVHLAGNSSDSALLLFEGTLSSYYLGKIKHGEVPSALVGRQVPFASWRSGGERVLAPVRPLTLGPHSLVSKDGLLAEFNVSAVRPLLERFWPPVTATGSPRLGIYCRPPSSVGELPSAGELLFEPAQSRVLLAPGVDEDGLFAERCSHFASNYDLQPGEIWVPPPTLGEWTLSPAIFSGLETATEPALTCASQELVFGPGCARVADDRVIVRTPEAAVLWLIHTTRGALLEVSASGSSLTIDGLLPDAQQSVWGSARDLSGALRAFELELHTAAARAHPILNEALADALGPEPQSEWIELFNDGSLAVDLGQYSLQDSGGRTALPHESVAPQQYALLVREDFAPNASDEPPAAGTLLIRLPTLGKSGLSNAGERLALMDSAGRECSILPALSGKAGQSLARRRPTADDNDPNAFSFGTPTPGFANDVPASAP